MKTEFGKLRVLGYSHKIVNNYHYICQCECGKLKTIAASNLYSGRTTSCGCEAKKTQFKKGHSHKAKTVEAA